MSNSTATRHFRPAARPVPSQPVRMRRFTHDLAAAATCA